MSARRHGAAWVFPGDITTDDILPGRFLELDSADTGKHAMAGVDPGFAARIAPGDLVVGGGLFGSGSGRESAAYALLHAGVGAIIAPGLGRIFYRNCVNIGLPAIQVDHVDGIAPGDPLVVDLELRSVTDQRTGVVYPIRNLAGISLDILRAGGIVAYTRRVQQRRLKEGT